MTTAIVASVIANKPFNGGNAWVVLSWALGLKRLGIKVHLVEQIERGQCIDASGALTSFEDSVNRAYFKHVTGQFGLDATLILEPDKRSCGLAYDELRDLAGKTDLLINITGHLTDELLTRSIKRRVYLDLDPGFTQCWHALGNDGARLAGHDFYFTIGENIGMPACTIPMGNLPWRVTRQPLLLGEWAVTPRNDDACFTTVASWRGSYGPVTYNGKTYGLKVHEFRKFLSLPSRTRRPFEIALEIHPAEQHDLRALNRHRWRIANPRFVACDPFAFRQYVQNSFAEFSAAQGVYVEMQSGWVSDRTVRYLASGKPALVQDTGLGHNYPVGQGLVTFRTLDEAIAGVERIESDIVAHSRAARALAQEYFDSDKVLTRLLEQVY